MKKIKKSNKQEFSVIAFADCYYPCGTACAGRCNYLCGGVSEYYNDGWYDGYLGYYTRKAEFIV
ncbi:MAG: hypothetical protein ACYCX2_00485 [Christensenellales bacterium]